MEDKIDPQRHRDAGRLGGLGRIRFARRNLVALPERATGQPDKFVNGGVNGLFPLALEGLVDRYGRALRNLKVHQTAPQSALDEQPTRRTCSVDKEEDSTIRD